MPGEEIDEFFKIRCASVANISLGSAMKKVLDFHRIRSKFGGIKKELIELGYGKIEVVEGGFKFISISETNENKIQMGHNIESTLNSIQRCVASGVTLGDFSEPDSDEDENISMIELIALVHRFTP